MLNSPDYGNKNQKTSTLGVRRFWPNSNDLGRGIRAISLQQIPDQGIAVKGSGNVIKNKSLNGPLDKGSVTFPDCATGRD